MRVCDANGGQARRGAASERFERLAATRSVREPWRSGRGFRVSAPSTTSSKGPGFRKDPGPLPFDRRAQWCTPAVQRPHTAKRRSSLTTCLQARPGTGRGRLARRGCSSAGRARPRHGRGHEFEARHPLHFGCAHALRCRTRRCLRCGMCAALARLRAARHPSDGTLAREHSRSGTNVDVVFV